MPGLAERLFWPVAKRWIAGREMDDALRIAREANERKIDAIINRLGEHTPDPKLIQEYTEEYLKLLERMQAEAIRGCISVKPSQLGLATSPEVYRENLSRILETAEKARRFVWIDMENSPYTEATLQVYQELLGSHNEVGICLQANLKRTENDLKGLLNLGAKIRLTKGAYPENKKIAYRKKSAIDENYVALMTTLFGQGNRFAIATHDEKLVLKAEALGKEHETDFEFQMLRGIRDDLKEKLAGEGYKVNSYIPYGPEWFNYSKRRLRERKRTIFLLMRSITG